MASKSSAVLLAVLSVLAVAVPIIADSTAPAPRPGRPGSYQPIKNPNAPEVVAVAKFAVAEHNKEKKTALELVSVVKGEWQVVAGVNYRLVISAKFGAAAPNTYTAGVYKNPKGVLKLTSFA